MTQRAAITSPWIIVSAISSVVTWVILYMLYIFVFGPVYVVPTNIILGQFGTKFPALQTMAANLTSQINAAFIIIAIGVFFFMLIAPYLFEPLSGGVGEPY